MAHTNFLTHTGKLINYDNILINDICIEDIAHHLTNTFRFGGALDLDKRYSVASHSLNCYLAAKHMDPDIIELQKAALMHDATEAYLGDVVTGLKHCLFTYRVMEKDLKDIIALKYDIDFEGYERTIGVIDKRMLVTEAHYLCSPKNYKIYANHVDEYHRSVYHLGHGWKVVPDKYPERIKQLFIDTCTELGIKD